MVLHIFLILKYGARITFWAADMMMCSRLQWGGFTRDEFLSHHEAADANAESWLARLTSLISKISNSFTRTDKSLQTYINSLNVLHYEFTVSQELDLIADAALRA